MVGAISVQGAGKTFSNADGSKLVALNDLNLEIKPGEFISLIGPSGCGKSTLLRAIAGLNVVDKGAIFLDGEKIKKPSYERGFVFQEANLFPWLTIRNNIAFGLKARGVYKERKGDVDEFIKLVGLEEFEKSFPHQLSGGMCQRASLARALVGHPKVLLLDEPLGALDAFTRMNMQDEILRIWKEHNMTMIMVTHDVDEAIYLSDRVVVMTPRPAKVEKIIDIDISRPRVRSQDIFLYYRNEILKILNFAGEVNEPAYYL
ncbi:MAG: ABC transporter ATP-binding protein [Clostridiales bacterium]|nr:ABC transporter ATP-binding protein [Clostridiales bacterium]